MAIDVKKWATRLYDDVPWPEQRQFVEGAIDLIRAVIADEAAKQKRDQSDGVLGRQPQSQPPEQTADVPGFGLTYYEWNILPASVRPKVESEIARRDAEIERLKAANTVLEADVRQLSASAKEARAEVERLSRPADIGERLIGEGDFIVERNAREAAEQRERKLRAFVKARVCGSQEIERQWIPLTEYDLDRLLAAFDAEGAKQ